MFRWRAQNPEDLLTLDALGLLLSPRSFNRIKDWRGLATRYDELAITYRGGVVLRAIPSGSTNETRPSAARRELRKGSDFG